MRISACLYSGLLTLSFVCACFPDGPPGSEAETTGEGDGDGDGDGDPGDGDGDGDPGDGDGDGGSGDGDGDGDGGNTDDPTDDPESGDGDGDGDGDDGLDVSIEMSNVQVSGDFMPVVPPDPWSVSFTLTVQNDSGQPVTLNHFNSTIIFNPTPNDNDGPDEFESTYEVDLASIDAPVGQSVHMLHKTSMSSVPTATYCPWPVQLDRIMFEIEGTEQQVLAGSPPTDTNCAF